MARTVEQIQQEFDAATLETRNTYDKLKNMRSSKTFIEKNRAKYEAAQEKYQAAQEKKNALKAELAEIQKAEETTAKKKTANDAYEKTLEELSAAEIGLSGYQGDASYTSAYQKAKVAYDAVRALGAEPRKPLPEQKIPVAPPTNQGQQGATGGTGGTQGTGIETAGAILSAALSSDKALLDLQTDLKNNFPALYKGAIDGQESWAETQIAVDTIIQSRGKLPKELQKASFIEFVNDPNSADLIIAGSGAGGANLPRATISSPTEAASTISYAIKNVLGREANTAEVAALTKVLNDAERKNPTRTVNGQTTGGLNGLQFITDLIKTGKYEDKKLGKLPVLAALAKESLDKKADKSAITKESLLSAMASNGVQLSEDQINLWTQEVQNGKDIEKVKQDIRNIAAAGMPDNVKKMLAEGTDLSTIYSPYKTQMAAILEINPNDIRLTDPSLTAAIGPNGEMPIYEYQRSLRKDPRWQYTNNARDAVADGLTTVLKDFGFMG
jgi:hypothetical protein